jgi:hypothetical protein
MMYHQPSIGEADPIVIPERAMSDFDPTAYGTAIEELLRRAPLNPLDAGQPDASVRPLLAALSEESFQPHVVRNRDMAAACRAGLWLRFDYLDESHKISQDIDTPEGSFWHGILHRREGDFDNAKYWFRRVGMHAVFEPLRQAAADLAATAIDSQAAYLVNQRTWDPFAYVDLCAATVHARANCEPLCREVQKREWELLFEHCGRHAIE